MLAFQMITVVEMTF